MRGRRSLPPDVEIEHALRRVRLAAALRSRREALGIAPATVAGAIHMKERSWEEVEAGRRSVRGADLPELMNVLRVDPGWFVEQMLVNGLQQPARAALEGASHARA